MRINKSQEIKGERLPRISFGSYMIYEIYFVLAYIPIAEINARRTANTTIFIAITSKFLPKDAKNGE
jgi:hypothetical protein